MQREPTETETRVVHTLCNVKGCKFPDCDTDRCSVPRRENLLGHSKAAIRNVVLTNEMFEAGRAAIRGMLANDASLAVFFAAVMTAASPPE